VTGRGFITLTIGLFLLLFAFVLMASRDREP
jgi:hypothetical protein